MVSQEVNRKLAAILSADVKGYSRLMGDDEVATVQTLTAYRGAIATHVMGRRGRVVDSPGDNLLAEFASVLDALQCATDVQEDLQTRNAALPDRRKMEFRIGINLGEVIVDGERIYGDGVNIAARLQAQAEGGGICVSGTVYDQIEGKLDLTYDYLGEQSVKNIAKPVRVYRVRMVPAAARAPGSPPVAASSLRSDAKPSIAVLPFVNMSGDSEQEYFCDGITEDIITDLSRLTGLFVIARNSAFSYKGKSPKVQDVGRDLGVGFVLEGSVRKVGDRVRITAQLVDAASGGHVWAERFDRDVKDIFALQDEITNRVVSVLEVKLTRAEEVELVEEPAARRPRYISRRGGPGSTP